MNEELKKEVVLKVEQLLAGAIPETNKFEFKMEWYRFNVKNDKDVDVGKNEFYKDICAIANAYGGEDGFIVIGIENNGHGLHNASIEDSGLNQSQIKDLILNNIDKPIAIDIDYIIVKEMKLSVIHVPISLDKPHLVSRYYSRNGHFSENVIFTRSGSGTKTASKGEIDRMYWERKNISIDRKIEVSFPRQSLSFSVHAERNIMLQLPITLENTGTRSLAIAHLKFIISFPKGRGLLQDQFVLKTPHRSEPTNLLVISPSKIEEKPVLFFCPTNYSIGELNGLLDLMGVSISYATVDSMVVVLSSGEEIIASVHIAEF